jgi:predicted dinucleotide-binding enzyme
VRIAVVGGTGDFGLALAQRLVAAGEDVVIGSRDAERAVAKGAEVGAAGASNEDAVRDADIVVLAVKADAALPTAESLADAIGDTPVLIVASELRFTKQGVFPTELL